MMRVDHNLTGPGRSKALTGLGLICVSIFMAGCGSAVDGVDRQSLSGTVTYGGSPVPAGTIHFEPDSEKGNSGPAGTATIEDGRYQTHPGQGAVSGPLIVRMTGYDGVIPQDEEQRMMYPNGQPLFHRDDLKIELPAGTTRYDFEIPDEGDDS